MLKKRKHLVIPDCQVKDGVPLNHLTAIGNYIVEKQPDVIINIGDFADMPSLSSYDQGKKSFEGRRYKLDIEVTHEAMWMLLAPMIAYNAKQLQKGRPQYCPRMVLTLGNHEDRISRAINSRAELDGTLSLDDLGYEQFGWEVLPFLEVVVIDGIAYSHYFTSGVMGRPVSSARALVTKKHMSCTMGHVQHTDLDMSQRRGDGKHLIGLFCGTCYQHDEDYLGPQGNAVRRQIWMKHEVNDGEYDPMAVSLSYLLENYL